MKPGSIYISLLLFISAYTGIAQPGNNKPLFQHHPSKFTLDSVIDLANLYIEHSEQDLFDKNRETAQKVKAQLTSLQSNPPDLRKVVNNMVSQLTITLADMKSADGITVVSAYLLKFDSTNVRTLNLFGAVLHAAFRFKDAVSVFEYAHIQFPGDELLMLNLATVYLDQNRDEAAKKMLDELVKLDFQRKLNDSEKQDTYKALSLYWYKKGNMIEFKNALLKASAFLGFVHNSNNKADKPVDENEINEGDDLPKMEGKINHLKNDIPLNTADAIENDYPDIARNIRDKMGKLATNDKMKLLNFPEVNTNSNKDFAESGPVIDEWIRIFTDKYAEYIKDDTKRTTGIGGNEGEAAIKEKAQQYAQDQITKALQQAQDAMKYLSNNSFQGIDPGLVSINKNLLKEAASKAHVTLTDNPVDPEYPPGIDSGGLYSYNNYLNFIKVEQSYQRYIYKYFENFDKLDRDNLRIYIEKCSLENKRHDEVQLKLDEDHGLGLHGSADIPCRREKVEHIIALNKLGNTYFKFWADVYIPQYKQKMKPILEDYWATVILYIRNMNDPEVVEREYYRVKGVYMQFALQAITKAAEGGIFQYMGSTEEEEKALADAISAAAEEAKAKTTEWDGEIHVHQLGLYPVPKEDWVDWIGKNLIFEISGDILRIKITAKSIEFEAFAPVLGGVFGPGAGIKADFLDETLETYISVGAKFKTKIQIGQYEIGVEAKGEVAKRTSRWDFANGKYEETFQDGLKESGKLSLGPVSAAREYILDSELNAKTVTNKVALKDEFGEKTNAFKDMSLTLQNKKTATH